MYAVIKSGGRQYKVSVGDTLEVNQLSVEDGAQVKFEEVLLISDADRLMVGTPLVDNAAVLATATRQARGKKVIVFRYKSKKRERHRRGHRQDLTVLTIDDIVADGISLVTGEPPEAKKAPSEEELAEPEVAAEAETPETEAEAEAEAEAAVPEVEAEQEKRSTRRRRTRRAESTDAGEVGEAEDTDSESKAEE